MCNVFYMCHIFLKLNIFIELNSSDAGASHHESTRVTEFSCVSGILFLWPDKSREKEKLRWKKRLFSPSFRSPYKSARLIVAAGLSNFLSRTRFYECKHVSSASFRFFYIATLALKHDENRIFKRTCSCI